MRQASEKARVAAPVLERMHQSVMRKLLLYLLAFTSLADEAKALTATWATNPLNGDWNSPATGPA